MIFGLIAIFTIVFGIPAYMMGKDAVRRMNEI